ncbi:homeodomain transcription factor [Mycena rebaudengoi]|nr:homeodomain transcription factor [Mycena rebaudengoi]
MASRGRTPRHRHSAAQLSALNDLYNQVSSPSLEQRANLGVSIGLETKTVNAWFQNKRASTKKRPRGVPYEVPLTSTTPSISTTPAIDEPKLEEGVVDYSSIQNNTLQTDGVPEPIQFLSESENMPLRMRLRPEQIEELRKIYAVNPHPTPDERQAIANRIEMRFQSVTNWFQNQRSLNKKKKEDEDYADPAADAEVVLSPAPLLQADRGRRSPSASSTADDNSLVSRRRRASSRRSATPYSSTGAVVSLTARQRRARPEPFQLDALKRLFNKTATPSIEERSALALEIGMEIGKVTNWFRNLRQSARKREKKLGRHGGGDGSDDDFDYTGFYSPSASVSRSGTPSSSSLEREDGRRGRLRRHVRLHSSDEDDEEEVEVQEAVTPSPSQSPSPTSSPSHARILGFTAAAALHEDIAEMADLDEKATARFSDIRVEDALLLLGFHRHTSVR